MCVGSAGGKTRAGTLPMPAAIPTHSSSALQQVCAQLKGEGGSMGFKVKQHRLEL